MSQLNLTNFSWQNILIIVDYSKKSKGNLSQKCTLTCLLWKCLTQYMLLLECHECIHHLAVPSWTRVSGGKWLSQDISYKDMLPLKDSKKEERKLVYL